MTSPLNRERFVKLMALAESGNDAEALAAVRKAACLARGAGLSLGEAVANGVMSFENQLANTVLEGAMIGLLQARVEQLEQQLANCRATVNDERLEQEHAKGYRSGHAAGRAEIERDVKLEVSRRIRELEAELEAYRAPLDWIEVADLFAFKNQRGTKAAFAKAVQFRARTGNLTPTDQAELRKFSEGPKRGRKAKVA